MPGVIMSVEVIMLIRSLPEEERPQEKALINGVGVLSDAELIALIIRTGKQNASSINLAEDVLSICDEGLFSMGTFSVDDLLKIDGIGPAKACTLMAAVELGKRIAASRIPEKYVADDPDSIAGMFMENLRYEKKEYFKSVIVNTKGEVISVDNVSVGELSSTLVHPREVFSRAVKKSAYGVIFVHNHPSGDPTPSEEDIATTARLVEGGEILGIKVLDHVIIGDGRYQSMRAMDIIR